MEAFDENLEPQVTIVKSETETREEFRIKGKLYMVKVTPAVGKPYYLVEPPGRRHHGRCRPRPAADQAADVGHSQLVTLVRLYHRRAG